MKMSAEKMWEAYVSQTGVESEYDAWAFGDDPDTLASLVLNGVKTATASAFAVYALEDEPLPKAGQYSVVLDSEGNAVCIIRNERVFVKAFCDVDEKQAFREGEGDRTLSYWRNVHERFFTKELSELGLTFSDTMQVVCEEFQRVYP